MRERREEMRLECAQRIQWPGAVEEGGLVRRCGAQAKDEEVDGGVVGVAVDNTRRARVFK
jgi:hypothetical protein